MMLAISSNLIILPVLSLGCVLAARQSLICAMRNRPWYLPVLLLWLRELSGNVVGIHHPHVSHLEMWGFVEYYSRGTFVCLHRDPGPHSLTTRVSHAASESRLLAYSSSYCVTNSYPRLSTPYFDIWPSLLSFQFTSFARRLCLIGPKFLNIATSIDEFL